MDIAVAIGQRSFCQECRQREDIASSEFGNGRDTSEPWRVGRRSGTKSPYHTKVENVQDIVLVQQSK